jgi:DNA-3-methyladenine glycosylase I
MPVEKSRCPWCLSDSIYIAYHDTEWGVPVHDDQKFFELLILEGAQAGLSWLTVLKKRENYRAAFDGFDMRKVAKYDPKKVSELLKNSGIIRNRLKRKKVPANPKRVWQFQSIYLAIRARKTEEKQVANYPRYSCQNTGV